MRSTNIRSSIALFIVTIFLLITLTSVHALPTSGFITSESNSLNKNHYKREATHVVHDQIKKSHGHGHKTQVQKQKVAIHSNNGGAAPSVDNGHIKKKSTKNPTPVSKIGSPCPPAMRPSGNICVPHHPFFKPN